MPSVERDGSRDPSPGPKHQHSASESGKAVVPMWDSSDPDRAPPPLPLNPQQPPSPVRADASAKVAAAAQSLLARARQNAANVNTFHTPPEKSPEKSPTKTAQHKRLQSIQNTNGVKENRSPPERRVSEPHVSLPSTPPRDIFSSPPDKSSGNVGTPTRVPSGKDWMKDTPTLRPASSISNRAPPRPILGENSPPSATMLAIQSMPFRDVETPLANITNSSNPRALPNMDGIHGQIQHLTSIATTLQKEMTSLSRRSKDNATDLLSLKEATKLRDEDIRKSLRELVTTSRANDLSRSPSVLGTAPFGSPSFGKSLSVPRFPLSVDGGSELDRAGSPSPYSVEGAASVAMLEKIIREMATKEGQERLISTLSEIFEKSNKESSSVVSKKVEELFEFIRNKSISQALVIHKNGHRDISDISEVGSVEESDSEDADASKEARKDNALSKPAAATFVSDDLVKHLQNIKDSISQGGGLSGEIKTLVRDLRGEVLGMGRDLGRKLEPLQKTRGTAEGVTDREELQQIVQDALVELKDQMEHLIRTRRRESSSSSVSRTTVDNSEVQALVKHALAERGLDQYHPREAPTASFDQEAILNAIKEAYETYKPEIEQQQLGLQRYEILQCLKEGLEDYQSTKNTQDGNNMSKEEIMDAIDDAIQHFNPPQLRSDAAEIKDEVLAAVQQGLEAFKPPVHQRSAWKPGDITREELMAAVKEGLGEFRREGARQIEINREDLFYAVKAGLDSTTTPFGGYGEEVLETMRKIVEGMRVEFKNYSSANGRDTEQVLDAMKDGLESLRIEIESYVDRAQDVTGKDEIMQLLRDGFERLPENVAIQCGNDENASRVIGEILRVMNERFSELQANNNSRGLDGPSDEMLDAMKEEFEQLRESVLNGTAVHKEEIVETIQDSLNSLHAKVESSRGGNGYSEDVVTLIREELAVLKETLWTNKQDSDSLGDKMEIANALRESLDAIRVQLAADQSEAASESLGAIREELESLREALGSSVVPRASDSDKEEILDAIRTGFSNMSDTASRGLGQDGDIDAPNSIKDELEHLRQSIGTALIKEGAQMDPEEMLDTVRIGFEELRSQIEKSSEYSGDAKSSNIPILDSLNEGVENIRSDIAKMSNKPMDMTVSYEILDTLKDGLSGLRSDIQRMKMDNESLKNGEVILADGSSERGIRGMSDKNNPTALKKSDLEKVQVMLTQLQIKMEAMDQTIQANSSSHYAESDTKAEFAAVESTLRELQTSIETLSSQERGIPDGGVTKEDTDAIETLLQNTKAKIDDQLLPALEGILTKGQLDDLEIVVRETNESIEGINSRMGESSQRTKTDIEALALMIESASSTLNEVNERINSESPEDKVTKNDLKSIRSVCREIQNKLDEDLNFTSLPTRDDVEQLSELLDEFKKNHETLMDRYESDIGITAKAFDDRKEEAESIMTQIGELKTFIEQTRDDLKSRVKRGNEDVRALDEILEGIEVKIDEAPNAVSGVEELKDIVNSEFERAYISLEELKSGQEAQVALIREKGDENQISIVREIVQKLDDRFQEVMTKQDEQQEITETAARTVTNRADQQESILTGSKALAEELKISIDALGLSMTEIGPTLTEATNKMSDDSKTVYNRVDDVASRIDYNHADSKVEHSLTRDEVVKTLGAISVLHESVNSFQPKFMDALSNLAAIVGEQFEQSKKYQEQSEEYAQKSADAFNDMKTSFESIPAPLLEGAPRSMPDEDNKINRQLGEILDMVSSNSHHNRINGKLDELLGLAALKFDHSTTHDKLDELLRTTDSSRSIDADSDKMEEIRQQVLNTATEISAFVEFQTKMLSAEHGNKEREANQAALDLTKYLAEKDELENAIPALRETKQSIAGDIESLRAECEGLSAQKTRLSAEVSSLETALNIRREELQTMDARADALEHRIIERVMDHSRALLIGKTQRPPPNMDLKRVTSNSSSKTATVSKPSKAMNTGMDMALNSRAAVTQKGGKAAAPAARRILSLNEITNNVPSGGKGISPSPRNVTSGLTNIKRSQTVKNPVTRKNSWAPPRTSISEVDKENTAVNGESDREEEQVPERPQTSLSHRSTSYADTHTTRSPTRTSYGTGSSEYTYGTGSYMTGTESDRRASVGSTIRSMIGPGTSLEDSIHEDEEEDDEERGDEENGPLLLKGPDEEEQEPTEDSGEGEMKLLEGQEKDLIAEEGEEQQPQSTGLPGKKPLVVHPPDLYYDSGLGSDLPTATMSVAMGSDYFAKAGDGG